MAEHIARQLREVLAKEHAALLAGDFDDIMQLTSRKEDLLAALPGSAPAAKTLSVVSREIARNQALLTAAMRGVRAAQATLTVLQENASGTTVYGRDGQVSRMVTGGQRLSQKL